MRVLQVTTHMNVGGIANYIASLSKAIAAHRVTTVIASSGGELEKRLSADGIGHLRVDLRTKFEFHPKVLAAAFALAGIARREGIDIIHAHSRVSQVAARIASRITGVPYVTTCHGYFRARSRKLFDTWGSRVIAISDAVAGHLKRDLGVSGGRIRVVYSGVDAARFSKKYSAEERRGLKLSIGLKDAPVIGTIGRLSPVKGQEHFIRAFAVVVADRPDAQALIVGDGPDKDKLRELSRDLGVDGSILFAGTSSDTRIPLAVMDIFALTSVNEGLGLSLLEALAAGKPCVASNVGGISDVIDDGSSGILTPVGDSAAISKAFIRLLDDPVFGERLGQNGRALIRKRFSLDDMAANVLGVYREVAGSRESGVGSSESGIRG